MSEKFYNPYQFIPVRAPKAEHLTDYQDFDTFKSVKNTFVRHDYWHEKSKSGRIVCTLEALSPLVVGGKQTSGNKESKTEGKVDPYRNRAGEVAIPANSLRGMITSIAESISQSSMRVLDTLEEEFYSTRMRTEEAFKEIGLLCKRDNRWFIYPLGEGEPEGDYRDEDDGAFLRDHKCFHFSHNNYSQKNGVFYIRGEPPRDPDEKIRKVHETFLYWDRKIIEKNLIAVDAEQIKQFEQLLRERYAEEADFPYLPKGYEKQERGLNDKSKPILLDGDLIYYKSATSLKPFRRYVTALSYSAIGRRIVEGNLADALKRIGGDNILPWDGHRQQLTPAEALFGVVEDKPAQNKDARNLAARVRFTDASLTEASKKECLLPERTLKILNSPKPPSPAMYFSTEKGSHISKGELNLDLHNPNGRKRYLPHPNVLGNQNVQYHFDTKLTGKDYRPHLHLKCQPVGVGTQFQFSIYFENLSPAEFELLYVSLTPSQDFVHRLGLGKPLGLGHVNLTKVEVEVVNRQQRYSLISLLDNSTEKYQPFNMADHHVPGTEKLIEEEALNELLAMSNPANIHHPICYPYSTFAKQPAQNEKEGFEWFVCNDRAAASADLDYKGQFLRRLNTKNSEGELEVIPTLDANIQCPAKPQGSGNKEKGNHKK